VAEVISNTSPILYLHCIGKLEWLRELFSKVWIPDAVVEELREGRRRGHDVPDPELLEWIQIVVPQSVPSVWLTLDLGAGELETLALALENPAKVVLLDDDLARRIGQAAGLTVWGTLKVLLAAKETGLTPTIAQHLTRLVESGMWISDNLRHRILALAGEEPLE
jgi:predicted nucleic acid-binding protein